MSDKPSTPGAASGVTEAAQWRVEGSADYHPDGAYGLDDTVVRLPPITGDGPVPVTRVDPTPAEAVPAEPVLPPPPVFGGGRPVDATGALPPVTEAVTGEPSDPAPTAIAPAALVSPAVAPAPVNPPVAASAPVAPVVASGPVAPPFAGPAPVAPAPVVAAATAPVLVAPAPEPAGDGAPAAAIPPKPKPAAPRPSTRRTRKARLRLARIDPWSVMKTSFLFSIAFGIMFWVATYVVWSAIGASGLFDAMNEAIQNILSSPNDTNPWRIEDYVNTNKVLGIAALIAVVNVVLMTALGTLTAFLYNLSANILGGLELTLAED